MVCTVLFGPLTFEHQEDCGSVVLHCVKVPLRVSLHLEIEFFYLLYYYIHYEGYVLVSV